MTYVPMPIEGFGFDLNEYVWDRVWGGPAIVVGTHGDKLTVAEIIEETRDLGRVAHRAEDELCRYVKLIVPEDEAAAVESGLFAETVATHGLVESFLTRLHEARERRGLIE